VFTRDSHWPLLSVSSMTLTLNRSLKLILMLSSHIWLNLPSTTLPAFFPSKISNTFLGLHVHTTWFVHAIHSFEDALIVVVACDFQHTRQIKPAHLELILNCFYLYFVSGISSTWDVMDMIWSPGIWYFNFSSATYTVYLGHDSGVRALSVTRQWDTLLKMQFA
jgi:hypothetical protein